MLKFYNKIYRAWQLYSIKRCIKAANFEIFIKEILQYKFDFQLLLFFEIWQSLHLARANSHVIEWEKRRLFETIFRVGRKNFRFQLSRYFEIYTFYRQHEIAGWFRVAVALSEESVSVADERIQTSLECLLAKCYLETCDRLEAELRFIEKSSDSHWIDDRLQHVIKSSFARGARNLAKAKNGFDLQMDSNLATIDALVRGCCLLLIGPAVNAVDEIFVRRVLNTKKKIVVIRIGDIGTQSVNLPDIRTDITFLRDHKVEDLSSSELSDLVAGKFVIASNWTSRRMEWLVRQPGHRYMISPIWGRMDNGFEFNAAPELLLLLLNRNPSNIFVTGFDLFCSFVSPVGYKKHPKKFGSALDQDVDLHHRIMAINHPVSIQFEIWWLAQKSGSIKCDEALERLIDGGLSSYLRTLTNTYEKR